LGGRIRTRIRRVLGAIILATCVVFAVCVAALYIFGVDAIGKARLRAQAEQAIGKLAGMDVDVTFGNLHLGLGDSSLFALEVRDARIVAADDGKPIESAGTFRFGLKAFPLFSGRVE